MIRKALTYLGIAVSLLPSLVGAKELSNERPVNFLDNGDVIEQEFVDRIDSFSSVLGDEVRAGLLGTDFVLSFLSGAIYRHGDVPEIGIPCEWRAFGERVCDWEALPHELGHHVYAGLSEDDKQRVGVVLEERSINDAAAAIAITTIITTIMPIILPVPPPSDEDSIV